MTEDCESVKPTAEDWKVIKQREMGTEKPKGFGFTWFREDGKGCGDLGEKYSRQLQWNGLRVSTDCLVEFQTTLIEGGFSAEKAWEVNRTEYPGEHPAWADLQEGQRQHLELLAVEAREAWLGGPDGS